jgi:hypothetical protein
MELNIPSIQDTASALTPTTGELQAFYDKCMAHNWLYELCDARDAYIVGLKTYQELQGFARKHSTYNQIFQAFKAYAFSGPAFDTSAQPKPTRP